MGLKNRMGRKLVSFILALTMVQTAMPQIAMTVRAEDEPEPPAFDDSSYTEWGGGEGQTTSLPTEAGTFKLTSDVTLATTWEVPGEITIDLHGHGIHLSDGKVIRISTGAGLTLTDCDRNTKHKYTIAESATDTGVGLATVDDTLTGKEGEDYQTFTGGYITGGSAAGGGAILVEGGSLTLSGGTIIGNKADGAGSSGGAILLKDDGDATNPAGATFIMDGGAVMYNTAADAGGGIAAKGKKITISISGGGITSNHAMGGNGGGLAIGAADAPTLDCSISGGVISSNIGASKGDGIWTNGRALKISGNPVIRNNANTDQTQGAYANDIYLASGETITITGALTKGAAIGIAAADPAVAFTTGYQTNNTTSEVTADPFAFFVACQKGYFADLNDAGEVYLSDAAVKVTYNANGGIGSVTDDAEYHCGDTVTVKSAEGLTKENAVFRYWSTTADGDGDIYDPKDDSLKTFQIQKNITLYAQWKQSISAEGVVTATGYTGVYDGEEHRIKVTVTADYETKVTYKTTGEYGTANPGFHTGNNTVSYKVTDPETGESVEGSAKIEISPAPLTIDIGSKSKPYGQDLVLNQSAVSVSGLSTGDTLTGVTIKGMENGKPVGEAVIFNNILNTDVTSCYTVTFAGSVTDTPGIVTVLGIKAVEREYNGSKEAVLSYEDVVISGMKAGDDLSVTATGTFENKNAGAGKTVYLSDLALKGADAAHYVLAEEGQQETCTGTILQKAVTVSGITAADKIYDTTTSAQLDCSNAQISGLLAGDDLKAQATGHFETAGIGENKRVLIDQITLSGLSLGNYKLADTGSQDECAASVTRIPVTVSGITAQDKEYDGTTNATLNYNAVTFDGKLDGDQLSVTATGTFAGKAVGSGKRVAISGLVLSGADAGKYELAKKGQQVAAYASITKKTVTLSNVEVSDKPYDGTTKAKIDNTKTVLSGKVTGDDLQAEAIGGFADKEVGEHKAVQIDGVKLSGTDAGNYELDTDFSQGSFTASITKCPITVSGIKAENKVYDAKAAAQLDFTDVVLNGKVEGERLSVSANGSFESAAAGNQKKVIISNLALTGEDAGNYILATDGQQTTATADIARMPLTVSGISAANKGYDGTTDATVSYNGVIFTDANGMPVEGIDLSVTATGTFEDKNIGEGKKVFLRDLTLGGEDAANYRLAENGQQTECVADIMGLTITVSGIAAKNKSYDGTTTAELDLQDLVLEGKSDTDRVSVSVQAEFEDAKAGKNKKVKILSLQLTGRDAVNYMLAKDGQQTECLADIEPVVVTVSGITAENKEYDGKTDAQLSYENALIQGKRSADTLSVRARGYFSDPLPGSAKSVSINDIELTGEDAASYVLSPDGQQTEAKADITITDGVVLETVSGQDGVVIEKATTYQGGVAVTETTTTKDLHSNLVTTEKTVYDADGNKKDSFEVTTNAESEITQIAWVDQKGNETVVTGSDQVRFGTATESVSQIAENLKKAGVSEAEYGSVLQQEGITPVEMAYLLKDEGRMDALLGQVLLNAKTEGKAGGAAVVVNGLRARLDNSDEQILKQTLTPTELVTMLARGEWTEVDLELEQISEDANVNAAEKGLISAKAAEDERMWYFDASLYKLVAGSHEKTRVTEFLAPIRITFPIPENLRKSGRSFRLVATHEGEGSAAGSVFEIPVTVDENSNLSFETDRLCVMALIYTDADIKAEVAQAKAEQAAKIDAQKVKEGQKEIDAMLAETLKQIEADQTLDAKAKTEAKENAAKAAEEAKKALEEKGSSALAAVKQTYVTAAQKAQSEGKTATEKRIIEKITPKVVAKNSKALGKGFKVKQKGTKLRVKWGKVSGADGYDVYVQYAGKKFAKKATKTLGSDAAMVTFKKLGKKKISIKKSYKVRVKAYRMVGEKKVILAKSKTLYAGAAKR